MQSGNQAFINQLRTSSGGPQLLTGDRNTERYRKGFPLRRRPGAGGGVSHPPAAAVAHLQACVAADKIVIMRRQYRPDRRSTPSNDYDRDIVIVSTRPRPYSGAGQRQTGGRLPRRHPAPPREVRSKTPAAANHIR
ncbi:hypothetical protein M8494_19030 [Serratia ureilytica]